MIELTDTTGSKVSIARNKIHAVRMSTLGRGTHPVTTIDAEWVYYVRETYEEVLALIEDKKSKT